MAAMTAVEKLSARRSQRYVLPAVRMRAAIALLLFRGPPL